MFKTLMLVYMGLYILIVLASGLYSYFKSKRMHWLGLLLTLLCLLVVTVSLVFYAQAYHPLQMVAFALSFTLISSIFFYNGVRDTSSKFSVVFTLSMIRLALHLQLLFFLYLFR